MLSNAIESHCFPWSWTPRCASSASEKWEISLPNRGFATSSAVRYSPPGSDEMPPTAKSVDCWASCDLVKLFIPNLNKFAWFHWILFLQNVVRTRLYQLWNYWTILCERLLFWNQSISRWISNFFDSWLKNKWKFSHSLSYVLIAWFE